MIKTREQLTVEVRDLRVASKNGGGNVVTGHAAVFDTHSLPLMDWVGTFKEKIAPGAFAESIQEDDIRALINHDGNLIIGRNKSSTLRLKEDDVGLAVEIDLPETSFARDLAVSLSRGDVTQMSFGFRVPIGGDSWSIENGEDIRTLNKVNLFDVSVVTFPAYPATDASVRSNQEIFDSRRSVVDKPDAVDKPSAESEIDTKPNEEPPLDAGMEDSAQSKDAELTALRNKNIQEFLEKTNT